jgi:hypothetical protein
LLTGDCPLFHSVPNLELTGIELESRE